jgi:hypothetical protein
VVNGRRRWGIDLVSDGEAHQACPFFVFLSLCRYKILKFFAWRRLYACGLSAAGGRKYALARS